ncbi:peptidoglycan DD-metalloendopeptidase family protein [Gammaproteobacteria bacterium]|nr:peptidoglycan DD-metalloendopeptidase family protein [Gammaproteobacteria bacterium]
MSFQDLDFKSQRSGLNRPVKSTAMPSSLRPNRLVKLLMATTIVTLLGFSVSNWQPSAKDADTTPNSDRLHYSLPLPLPDPALQREITEVVGAIEPDRWESVIIKSGDTLASIFSKKGISSTTTHKIATLNEQTRKLRYIQPGDEIKLLLDEQRQLRQMKYIPDITRTLLIQRNEDLAFTSQIINYQLDAYPVYREGVIDSSLFEAAANADIPEDVIMDLVAIFGWDIDFSLDIRSGDRFGIVYEELYKDDVKIRNGRILSANFINNGKTYRAAYYTDPSGDSDYYTPDGKSMRKAFLRSPVKFSRISSRFSNKRWHPVLSKWRSHKGVDYAAARGTPVRASGDGKITFAGTKGGYGRLVVIRHGGRYTTAYGHLHRYAKGTRAGKKVKQGQIIGYVGSSGLATGPHLHYEFRVNGVHRNPLTVKLPEAQPVNAAYLDNFREQTQVYLSMLRLMDRTLADNSQ